MIGENRFPRLKPGFLCSRSPRCALITTPDGVVLNPVVLDTLHNFGLSLHPGLHCSRNIPETRQCSLPSKPSLTRGKTYASVTPIGFLVYPLLKIYYTSEELSSAYANDPHQSQLSLNLPRAFREADLVTSCEYKSRHQASGSFGGICRPKPRGSANCTCCAPS